MFGVFGARRKLHRASTLPISHIRLPLKPSPPAALPPQVESVVEELQREKGEAKAAAKAAASSEEQSRAKIIELEQALGRVNADLKGSLADADRWAASLSGQEAYVSLL